MTKTQVEVMPKPGSSPDAYKESKGGWFLRPPARLEEHLGHAGEVPSGLIEVGRVGNPGREAAKPL
jgi:hypothetical protein